jgi:hypothetical protein
MKIVGLEFGRVFLKLHGRELDVHGVLTMMFRKCSHWHLTTSFRGILRLGRWVHALSLTFLWLLMPCSCLTKKKRKTLFRRAFEIVWSFHHEMSHEPTTIDVYCRAFPGEHLRKRCSQGKQIFTWLCCESSMSGKVEICVEVADYTSPEANNSSI